MGITAAFLIKHVRPADYEAYAMMTRPGPGTLNQWLLEAGASQIDIGAAFDNWTAAGDHDITDPANTAIFVSMASGTAGARWAVYGPTERSTILFLNGAQLAALSAQSALFANRAFEFNPMADAPHQSIALAVTISQSGGPPQVQRNVPGANLAADANGDCVHFAGLVT